MRIHLDTSLCQNTGLCTGVAPDTFQLDDDGTLRVLEAEPPEERRAEVEDAVDSCPMSALSLSEVSE